MPVTPILGHIAPQDRTPAMVQAAERAYNLVPRAAAFGLPVPTFAKGESVRLFDAWKDPKVVADVGFAFTRRHQVTGSCVEAGCGNALMGSIAMQRVAIRNPRKAFMPFTWHNYALGRRDMGDTSEGDGCMGSLIAASTARDGIYEWNNDGDLGMPRYTRDDRDGILVVGGRSTEYDWSSSRNRNIPGVLDKSRNHRVGNAARCDDVQDVKAAIANGYGVAFACNNYVSHPQIRGSGKDACVVARWGTFGPHQQSILAYWEHPTLGPLYWAQNNWDAESYPADPAGGPLCGCWIPEDEVTRAFRLDAEVYLYSDIPWIGAQPEVLSWYI